MSENMNVEALQTTLVEDIETEEVPTLTLEEIVTTLMDGKTEFTGFALAKVINQVFEATSTDKTIPPQMMYIYGSKGMVAKRTKGMPGKEIRYTADEAYAFTIKYTAKHVTI